MNLADLKRRFDEWEERTRGFSTWPHRVSLEPPYSPFLADHRVRAGIIDDTRRPSLWERLSRRRAISLPAPVTAVVAVPAEASAPDEIVELQVLLPKDFTARPDLSKRCFDALSAANTRLSFEIVGRHQETVVQIACDARRKMRVLNSLRAFFPETRVRPRSNDLHATWAALDGWGVIVSLGLSERVFRSLRTDDVDGADPYMDLVARLGEIEPDELGLVQVLFEIAHGDWGQDFVNFGKSIDDVDDVLPLMEEKFKERQFAVGVRIAAIGATQDRAFEIANSLAIALSTSTRSSQNELILVGPADGGFESEAVDLLERATRRSGMLLSLSELSTLAHFPSAVVQAEHFLRQATRTRAAPSLAAARDVALGANEHEGEVRQVGLSTEGRLRHTYCIGASGTGKSTLLLSMIAQDVAAGRGLGVIDPHGDLIDDVLARIPPERAQDVVLFDPSDEEYPVGFNVLSAHSELERTLLASDLVGVFKRFSSTFGDQMAAVLGNAVLAFLESSEGGNLMDLRNFLVDKTFRETFLKTVRDDEVRSYWAREFPMLKGTPQGSILTRLNTFLRPKTIRYMVAQRRDNLDLRAIMDGRKILLAKLSHGAIGEENAYLLGSLLVARVTQAAMSRQDEDASKRVPFILYMDEFQHFITPSISAILSGTRKYGLGLVLSHQEIRQLKSRSDDALSAVLGNAFTRVVFRVGEHDAKTLAEGLSHFEPKDLQNLGIGEAIVRIERPDFDFNLKTWLPSSIPPDVARQRRQGARAASRERYATSREIIESEWQARAERSDERAAATEPPRKRPGREAPAHEEVRAEASLEELVDAALPGRGGPQHKYLQDLLRKLAEDRGFDVKTEVTVLDGHGHVDAVVSGYGHRVAFEISVSARLDHEIGNITKCLSAGFELAALVCEDRRLLDSAKPELANAEGRVRFLTPNELPRFFDELATRTTSTTKTRKKQSASDEPVTRKRFLTAREVAEELKIAEQTLAKKRWSGDSPPFHKIGRKVVYDRDQLEAWIKQQKRRSTSDPGDDAED